jgi:outer membrane protein assembly factor BamE (lipoprotein component of BamABCDE complex)
MVLMLVACATTIPRGHLKEDESLTDIKIGTTTKDDVQKILGSPSSESSFGPTTWYYVSSTHQTRSILPTKIVDQHVIEVAFDSSGNVSSLRQYSLADGKNVEVASDVTPTEGQKLGFFEQIFSNLGRFNNNKDGGTSNSHTHGSTSPTGYPGR